MTKLKKFGLGAAAALISVVVVNAGLNSAEVAAASEEGSQFVQVIENNGCLQCHSAEPASFWYANLPGLKATFDKDMTNAYNFIDLESVVDAVNNGEQVSPADIAKIEQSTLNYSMPIQSYRMVHWGSSLNANERQAVLDWVNAERTAYISKINDIWGTGWSDDEIADIASRANFALPDPDIFEYDEDKVKLGLALYHDTRLSGDQTIACASCHPLNNAGVDGSRTSRGIGAQMGGINAPPVYNAIFNLQQFWNGRAEDLQAQAGGPPLNPVEMGSTDFDEVAKKLKEDDKMVAMFEKVYGSQGINGETITDAIAHFESKLIAHNSRFDQYLAGDESALTAEELKGYKLFKEYYCATCHVGATFGGQSFEKFGTTESIDNYFAERGTEISDDDKGLVGFTEDEADLYKFKVPNLRNVELTGPYLHDGTQLTLQKAIKTMLRFQCGNPNVSAADVDNIAAFLTTLTGENEYMDYEFVPNDH